MSAIRIIASLFFSLFLISTVCSAQQQNARPALGNDYVGGQLSVVFKEGASEADARLLLEELGYDIVDVNFLPVWIWADLDQELSPARLDLLRAQPSVASVVVEDMEEKFREMAAADPNFPLQQFLDAPDFARYHVVLHLNGIETLDEVEAVVYLIEGLKVRRVEKQSSEIIIEVMNRNETEAIARLRESELVAYVTHVVPE